MKDTYYIVHASVLPDYFEKVIEATQLLEQKKVKSISEAVVTVGISRSTYYKYKDYIHPYTNPTHEQKAIISLLLNHQKGILSKVLNILANNEVNILTISQSLPIHDIANVLLSLDISHTSKEFPDIINEIKKEAGVTSLTLVALE